MSANVVPFKQDWEAHLQVTTTGSRRPNLYNASLALRYAKEFAGKISYNDFTMQVDVAGNLPWERDKDAEWCNHDDLAFTEWLQGHRIQAGLETTQQAIQHVAYERRRHPVREWLNSLQWDGEPRIHDWLTTYCKADRSDYVQAVGKAWLISAVARIMRPGCKADHMLVLEGDQGLKKSTAFKALCGEKLFTDELADFGSKDAAMQMRGKWIIELAELDHLGRIDAARIKAFMARGTDRFRPPYGARMIESPRECVFAGTVNLDGGGYLKDPTGNRRFWPVRTGSKLLIEELARDRNQLWAEAVVSYMNNEQWWLEDAQVIELAKEEQEDRRETDAWEDPIVDWCSRQTSDGFSTTQVLTDAIGKKLADIRDGDNKRAAKCLRLAGYERKTIKPATGVTFKGWRKVVRCTGSDLYTEAGSDGQAQ